MELSPSHETEAAIPRAYIFNPPPPPALHRYCASSNGGRRRARYRECLRNHAAAIGGHALDGCGEFMPGGEEGTPEALRCSACRCHRNFHRREADGGEQQLQLSRVVGQNGVLISAAPPPHHHQMVVPLGVAPHGSEHSDGYPRAAPARRRFRTKFTPEQKERMLEFAERAGWRLPRRQEEEVQRFCMEIGVRRRVLKVWMHNNKHSLARRTSTAIAAAVTAPPPPPPPAAATAAVAPV